MTANTQAENNTAVTGKADDQKGRQIQADWAAHEKTSPMYFLETFTKALSSGNADLKPICIPTGFSNLDEALGGGFHEGVTVIGAISSIGKSTLIAQVADQIAKTGRSVIFFTLEESQRKLVYKSISRETAYYAEQNGISGKDFARKAREVADTTKYAGYTDLGREVIDGAIEAYSKYAGNLFIYENTDGKGIARVREAVKTHTDYTGSTPVVIIDYLQVLASFTNRASDKQNLDKAIMELTEISKDFMVPVIAISSLNRHSYNEPVTMTSFKESGNIEYGADVLIGMQLKGVGVKGFNSTAEKGKNPRNVELTIIKNRDYEVDANIKFSYYTEHNYFREI